MARQMKDSGIKWISMIPQDWYICQFKNIVEEVVDNRGRTPTINEDGKGIPLLELDSIGGKYPRFEKVSKFIGEESYSKFIRKDLLPGDVLFGTVGSVGKCSIVPEGTHCCIAQNIVGYRFNDNQVQLFWFYYFQSEPFKQMFMQFNKGNIQSSIKISDMARGSICVPPKAEQERIAIFLEQQCDEIDAVISKTKATIEEYKKLKQSVITEAVTKGIRGDRPMKDSGIEWIGNIPADWDIKVAFQLFKQVKNKNEGFIEQNLLSLSYGKIKRRNIDAVGGLLPESFDGYNIIEKDDIVLRLTDLQNDQTSLRVGLANERGIVTSAYLTLRNQSANTPLYLYYYLHSFDLCKGFYGMGAGVRQGLNWDGLKLLKFALPSVEEQMEITEYLEKKCSEIDALIEKKTALLAEMESYKKSVIYEYVTGKKEVQ